MLVARDANSLPPLSLGSAGRRFLLGQINANAIRHSSENHNSRLMQGTCWSAGCHGDRTAPTPSYHFRN